MRKLLLGLVGASALAMGTAANATMIVATSTQVSAVTGGSNDGGIHFNFSYTSSCGATGAPPAGSVSCGPTYSPFEATVSFINDTTGFYGFGIQQTAATVDGGVIDPDTDVDFSNAFVNFFDGTSETLVAQLVNQVPGSDTFEAWSVSGVNLAANTPGTAYIIHILGNRGVSSSFDGNIQFSPGGAVPEPATWAMMLLGFGAIGWQLRRRQRPVLLQAA